MKDRYPFTVEKVKELISKKYCLMDICKELAPGYSFGYYYKWKATLTSFEKKQVSIPVATMKTFKEVKINRDFKYLETSENTALPFGHSQKAT